MTTVQNDLRGFGGRGLSGRVGLIARPGRLKRHAPVKLAVGATCGFRWATEVEIRVSRVADRPATIIRLKGFDRLGLLGFLGHVPSCCAHLLRKIARRPKPADVATTFRNA